MVAVENGGDSGYYVDGMKRRRGHERSDRSNGGQCKGEVDGQEDWDCGSEGGVGLMSLVVVKVEQSRRSVQ